VVTDSRTPKQRWWRAQKLLVARNKWRSGGGGCKTSGLLETSVGGWCRCRTLALLGRSEVAVGGGGEGAEPLRCSKRV
jgi:hypothetical protein